MKPTDTNPLPPSSTTRPLENTAISVAQVHLLYDRVASRL